MKNNHLKKPDKSTMSDFTFSIRLMELNDINEAANVLSIAMQNNPLHIAVLKGNGESQRLIIEKMFIDLFNKFPGITFVAKVDKKIIGVMRMKSCCGSKHQDFPENAREEDTIDHRIAFWHKEWARNDPFEQHWHLGPIGVLPFYRRLGIGTALMKIFCTEVDRCCAKAFLETDFDENVFFYNKFGFEIVSTSNIFAVESKYMARNSNSIKNMV
jgi:ribosomal protein S18 acetylase RimI-like enzyme